MVPKATCWIGTTENPAFSQCILVIVSPSGLHAVTDARSITVGNEPIDQLAHRILTCQGPSGPNRVSRFCHDNHVSTFQLELKLQSPAGLPLQIGGVCANIVPTRQGRLFV